MSSLRIGMIATPFVPVPPPKYGGTEQVVHHLIRGLAETGHQVTLLAPGDSQIKGCRLVPTVERALFFPTNRSALPAYQKLVRQAERRTHDLIRQLLPEVDILHSHGFDLLKYRHFPNLTTLHGRIDFDQLRYYLRRRQLYYVSISNNQQEVCPDLHYVGVVYNGEDPADFPIVTRPEDYVCFLGRFDRDKNPHLAIKLAINLGIKIKVAGKIDYQGDGYFEQEVAPLLKHRLVEYLGELGLSAKVELLGGAKCNLHPTGFREPFGLTVLEAAYCGTPTLAIARGSMPELIEEGRTGMLVEDFEEGYHQIEECFKMNRRYIANRARLLFNYRTMTQQYINAYQSVIRNVKAANGLGRLLRHRQSHPKGGALV